MSLPWLQRKSRLSSLLKSTGDENADGIALDRLLHGQQVIGKTGYTTEIDSLRFRDKDLDVVGTLEYGQFGVIDVVTCQLDGRVYVRKSIEKRFALRTRDQCFPLFERNILLMARITKSKCAPHLLCAFQTPTHLKLVMDYAQGGTLWDVLESSPCGSIPEKDLKWWMPQIISAIHWCHSQGFAHRDIKPHNFVLTSSAHVLLIDFGSAAPLLPPDSEGVRKLPKQYCLVPCGTCDYISPEILKAHEEVLVALEMEDEGNGAPATPNCRAGEATDGYGSETDWWSLGAMLYELAYGVAPFFASDIRQTYMKIINHEKSLRFDLKVTLSTEYKDFVSRLLTRAQLRLGRRGVMEIKEHPVFEGVEWTSMPNMQAPSDLHLPKFTYANAQPHPKLLQEVSETEMSLSQGFTFSAFFQSSLSASVSPSSSNLGVLEPSSPDLASFIGFSWGPSIDSFDHAAKQDTRRYSLPSLGDSNSIGILPSHDCPPTRPGPTPISHCRSISTPARRAGSTPFGTLPRASTLRRSVPRRAVSDREAMKQLVDCVGMSARKKVLESGRTPHILTPFGLSRPMSVRGIRFRSSPIPLPDYTGPYNFPGSQQGSASLEVPRTDMTGATVADDFLVEDTVSDGPPSPSPRPGSAMSKSSSTPTASWRMFQRLGSSSTYSSTYRSYVSALSENEGRDPSSRQAFVGRDQGTDETIASFKGQGQRLMTASSSTWSIIDVLEEQHALLMKDIGELEQRFLTLDY